MLSDADREVLAGREIDAAFLADYAAGIEAHPFYEQMCRIKTFSMLHVEALMLLRLYGMSARRGVLQLGCYMGGSTTAIALGLQAQASPPPFVAVEVGGASNNPHIPSVDILADLKRNVEREGVRGLVHIVEGYSYRLTTEMEVDRVLGRERIDLLFIDSDGAARRDFDIYSRYLSMRPLVALDDLTGPANVKKAFVNNFVDESLASGALTEMGRYGWDRGTWFGRWHRR